MLGSYPTPVAPLPSVARALGADEGSLWIKRDDLTDPTYGGNKVRKLARLFDEAREKGAKRIVTTGAVGSHHVLATALHAQSMGVVVEAVLAPQPASAHVEEVMRIDAKLGVVAYPVGSFAAVPVALAARLRPTLPSAYFIPPGGSSPTGALGYVDAAHELVAQIARGELPKPRSIVVALGSGGTVAGLLVGMLRAGLLPDVELVAVQVVPPPFGSSATTLALALAVHRRLGGRMTRATIATLSRALRVVGAQLGAGYGAATEAGDAATAIAADAGLALDPTYTAKAFAAVIDEVRSARRSPVLYWHTLAGADQLRALLVGAPPVESIDPRVRALMRT